MTRQLLTRLLITVFLITPYYAMANTDSGLTHQKSAYSVKQTTDNLINILKKKGMTVFARIDHAAGAKKVNQTLRPTELVIFGNPKVGTPLMQCAQTTAIDLPQKALIWEDDKGDVYFSYNNPNYLVTRHNITGCEKVIKKVTNALAAFAKASTTPK